MQGQKEGKIKLERKCVFVCLFVGGGVHMKAWWYERTEDRKASENLYSVRAVMQFITRFSVWLSAWGFTVHEALTPPTLCCSFFTLQGQCWEAVLCCDKGAARKQLHASMRTWFHIKPLLLMHIRCCIMQHYVKCFFYMVPTWVLKNHRSSSTSWDPFTLAWAQMSP